jgi:hypothetical protein
MPALEKITSNQWTLQAVKGYELDFKDQPQQSHRPQIVETHHQSRIISEEIQKLLEKGAIQEVSEEEEDFYSRLFLIPKKDGQMRSVINLRPLNQFLVHYHFKMEGMHIVRDLQKNDWMTRIDLKDAYFSILINPQYQKFLRFKWQTRAYQFTCLPFGLASAPRVFTKILHPVVGFLRSKGVRCIIYLDDILLEQDKTRLVEHTATIVLLLEALGFLVNYPKSVLEPAQKLHNLPGLHNRFSDERAEQEKMEVIIKEAKAILELQKISARSLAQLIGKMSAALLAIQPAPLHYRSLQNLKHIALKKKGYNGKIGLSPSARKDLEW